MYGAFTGRICDDTVLESIPDCDRFTVAQAIHNLSGLVRPDEFPDMFAAIFDGVIA